MTAHSEHDDILGGHQDGESSGYKLLSFKDEMAQMPFLMRLTIYLCLFCWLLLCLQCVFIMPVILTKYGWGYAAAFIH